MRRDEKNLYQLTSDYYRRHPEFIQAECIEDLVVGDKTLSLEEIKAHVEYLLENGRMTAITGSIKLFASSGRSHAVARDSQQSHVFVLPVIAAAQGNWATLALGFPFFHISLPAFGGRHEMAAKGASGGRTRE